MSVDLIALIVANMFVRLYYEFVSYGGFISDKYFTVFNVTLSVILLEQKRLEAMHNQVTILKAKISK